MKTKLMTFILMIMMLLSMASCGFIVEEETIEIESIVPTLITEGDRAGETMIVITYKNNAQDPTIFYIPKGEDGVEGVGIEAIEEVEALIAENN